MGEDFPTKMVWTVRSFIGKGGLGCRELRWRSPGITAPQDRIKIRYYGAVFFWVKNFGLYQRCDSDLQPQTDFDKMP